METLEADLKRLIIETFALEGLDIADIDSDAPLFVEGLGLDSIDSLELGLALRKKYAVRIDSDTEVVRHFASIHSLARFVAEQIREKPE
jgi:acyl carrier protein